METAQAQVLASIVERMEEVGAQEAAAKERAKADRQGLVGEAKEAGIDAKVLAQVLKDRAKMAPEEREAWYEGVNEMHRALGA